MALAYWKCESSKSQLTRVTATRAAYCTGADHEQRDKDSDVLRDSVEAAGEVDLSDAGSKGDQDVVNGKLNALLAQVFKFLYVPH